MRRKEDARRLTEFGGTVLSLAMEKGISTQRQLAGVIEDDEGRPVDPQRLSPWLRGVYAPPRWLPRALSRGLDLTHEQNVRLAVAYSFGADRRIRFADEIGGKAGA